MTMKRKTLILAALAVAAPLFASQAQAAGGLISIIVNDPANPYWLAEGNIAAAEAKKLGYSANVSASKGDTNTESQQIDTAITNKSVAIILDPANASGSVGAVKKAIAANIPVFLVNAEINQPGLAKAQLVSNNAQGAALGAQQWTKDVGSKGNYVELLGSPSITTRDAVQRLQVGALAVSGSEDGRLASGQLGSYARLQCNAEPAPGAPGCDRRDQRQR